MVIYHCLVEVTPYDPAGGSRPTIRLASANLRTITGLGGQTWEPALIEPPKTSLSLFGGDFSDAVRPGAARLPISLARVRKSHPFVDRAYWPGAQVKIHVGRVGDAWPWTTHFSGRVKTFERDREVLALGCEVDEEPFLANVLPNTYEGTGLAEGGVDLTGRPKPLVLGHAMNVEPTLIDAVNSVYQFSGYGPIQGVDALFERAANFGPSLGNYATYAALVAADIPAGRWATCLAQGMIRLGAPAYGLITGDIRGHVVSGSTPQRPGAIIRALASIAGVNPAALDTTTLNAMDAVAAALPSGGNTGIVIDQQARFLDLARRIALPFNHQAGISLTGKLFAIGIDIDGSGSLVLHAQGRAAPQVIDAKELTVSPPYSKTMLGANRAWRVHSADEIAFDAPLIPRGLYDPAETYRLGNIVTLADKSQWLYVADDPSAGNAPPAWPATSNTWWANLEPPVSASDIKYEDGTPIEDLKPAEPGATEGAPPGTPVGDRPAEQVINELDQLEIDSAAHTSAIAAAEAQISDLFDTYGDTASAAASAAAAAMHADNAAIAAGNAEQAEADAAAARDLAQAAVTAAEQAKADAESAEDAAVAAASAASGSASTAAGHATTAATKADEAAGSATAAAGSATTATTKAGEASVSAGQAASSATTAEGYMNAAASSATVAANASDAAQGHANAASSSASTAGTHASDAASSASAANTAKTQAETAQGQAQTFASNAASSATDAEGSANSASQSATVSASSARASEAALAATFPEVLNASTLTLEVGGAPSSVPTIAEVRPGWVVDDGAAVQVPAGAYLVGTAGVLRLIDGEIYEIAYTAEAVAQDSTVYIYLRYLADDYSFAANSGVMGASTMAQGEIASNKVLLGKNVSKPGVINITGDYPFVRVQLLTNRGPGNATQNPDAVTKIHALFARNVTARENALESASAAATSASTAATHASNAGTSASVAQTAATTATTKAGEASTSASQASSSASDALGYRNTASTHASNAANSATNAGNSASAASNSASTATTKASEAASSASAANTAKTQAETARGQAQTYANNASTSATNAEGSANSASSSASVAASSSDAARLAGAALLPSDFSRDGLFWHNSYNGDPASRVPLDGQANYTFANRAVEGRVVVFTRGAGNPAVIDVAQIGVVKIEAGRHYRVTARFRRTAGTGNVAVWGFGLDSSYSVNYTAGISNAPAGTTGAWYEHTVEVDGTAAIAGGAVWLRAGVRGQDGTSTYEASFVRLEDITAQREAGLSASAAATSASTAATHASNAGTSASAAQTAATQAQGHAGNASTSAGTATTQASIATASAAAAEQSAILAASVGHAALNANPTFGVWGSGENFPASWGGTPPTKQAGIYSPNAATLTSTAGQNSVFINQTLGGAGKRIVKNGDWLVLEADATLLSGTMAGAGIAVSIRDSSGGALQTLQAPFGTGATAGAVYSIRSLVQVTHASAHHMILYASGHVSWHGSIAAANSVRFHRASVRYATEAEIRDQTVLAPLEATVSTQGSALATLDSQYASLSDTVSTQGVTITNHTSALSTQAGDISTLFGRAGVKVDVNGRVTGWETNNNGQTGDFKIHADYFSIEKPGGGPSTTFADGVWRVTTGTVMMAYGVPFGSSNQFIQWWGPHQADLANCTEANALLYLKADGTAYFGGATQASGAQYKKIVGQMDTTSFVQIGPSLMVFTGSGTVDLGWDGTVRPWGGTGSQTYEFKWQRSANGTSGWTDVGAVVAGSVVAESPYYPASPAPPAIRQATGLPAASVHYFRIVGRRVSSNAQYLTLDGSGWAQAA